MPGPRVAPRSIGGFTITRLLGEGGMGRVYLGRRGGVQAAVKVVRAELAGDPEFRARFGHEIEAATRVRSPYTAALLGADADGDPPWMATEYVPAPSLREAVGVHGPMPAEQVRLLGIGLAEALAAIHAAGIVHRDLKPGNVLLGADGPKVIDFGIARAADATVLTRTGAVVGSPGFIAPEQITHARSEPAGDVFALGGVLAYAATGRAPFGTGDVNALLYRTVHGEPDLAGIPEPLLGLVRVCLDRDPARRPTTDGIRATLSSGPQDRPTGGWLPAVLEPTPPRPVARAPRWKAPVAVGAAVAVLAAVAVVGVLALRGHGDTGAAAAVRTAPTMPTMPTVPTAPPTSPTSAAPATTTAADVRVSAEPAGFSSPSGNIACFLQPNSVRCDIAQAEWDPTTVPDRPAGCAGVWGDSLQITGTERADLVCHSDTVFGTGPVLDYSRALRVGDVTCTSRPTGVECRVGASGHGFGLSRTAYQLF
ncbi:serine/threonine protein kinase [Pseudonocardia kujensis]|uniref:serine/threonine-protein kinase n=1 Tax=Pseudonocardia kujensis TaxID=1128675 RepID=UPI001E5ADFDB|nr:serine/threonine-protein kinase [Pseudonocardia kujensis]MCE0766396.1 serine/threonine protein kinase [Pseudonocardia kujensis]